MVQKYISPCTKEGKKEEMKGSGGGKMPYKLPWIGERKKGKKKKQTQTFRVLRTRQSQSQIYALKSKLFKSNIYDSYQNFK